MLEIIDEIIKWVQKNHWSVDLWNNENLDYIDYDEMKKYLLEFKKKIKLIEDKEE